MNENSRAARKRGGATGAPGTAQSEFAHHYATVGRVRLHYVTCGVSGGIASGIRRGRGTPVVLLHGWPQTWYEWRLLMPLLADRYQLIAPDLRGLGDSSRPATGYDKKTVAHDIWLLLHEQLGHARFAVKVCS